LTLGGDHRHARDQYCTHEEFSHNDPQSEGG
jgi:hypothetical protein